MTAVEGGKEAECKRPKRTEPVNERVVLTVEESETMLAERPSSAAAVRPTAMSTVLPRVPARSGPQQAQTAQIEAARTTSPVPAPAHERPPVSPPPMLAVSAAVADLIDLDFSDAAAWRPGDANVSEVDPGFFDRLFSSPPFSCLLFPWLAATRRSGVPGSHRMSQLSSTMPLSAGWWPMCSPTRGSCRLSNASSDCSTKVGEREVSWLAGRMERVGAWIRMTGVVVARAAARCPSVGRCKR